VEAVGVFLVIGLAGVAIAGIVTSGIRSTVLAASRQRAQTAEAEGTGEALRALEERVEELQRQVAELAERQDFAERLLAQARERGLLSAPPPK
jgi:cell division protein FtsB